MGDQLSRTSRAVAAARAVETERDGALFVDVHARDLAGAEGFAFAAELAKRSGSSISSGAASMFAVRTRWFDDAVSSAAASSASRQIVILGAGMDTRAVRLEWQRDTVVFELDREQTFEYKEPILRRRGARARCDRRIVPVDLSDGWTAALFDAGFDDRAPTVWVAEGLVYYMPEPAVHGLLDDVTASSAPGSQLVLDVHSTSMRDEPTLERWRELLVEWQEPFRSFVDDGVELLASHGWDATGRSIARAARDRGVHLPEIGSLAVDRLLSAVRR